MGIVKFSIWLNIPSKYVDDLCHCFCYCGYIFWHILSGFFSLFFGISLAVVKTGCEMWIVWTLFFQKWPAFFVFDLCHICLLSASWVLFLTRIFQIAKIGTLTFLLLFSQVANLAKVTKIWRFQNVVNQVVLLYFVSNKKLM